MKLGTAIFTTISIFFTIEVTSAGEIKGGPHDMSLVCSGGFSVPKISLTLEKQYEMLSKEAPENLRMRLREVRHTLEDVAMLPSSRPVVSEGHSSFLEITTVAGGLSGIKMSDFVSAEARQKIINRIAQANIKPEMWIAGEGEAWPPKGYAGLAKDIVEYEYGLSALMTELATNTDNNGFVASSIFDSLVKKHQTYLNQCDAIKRALDEGYSLAGFDQDGIVPPRGLSRRNLVGHQIVVEIGNPKKGKTIVEQYVTHTMELSAWNQFLSAAQPETLPPSQLPESLKVYLKNLAKDGKNEIVKKGTLEWFVERESKFAKNAVEQMPPEPGVYSGTIEESYPAGFVIRIGPNEVITVNTNWFDFKILGLAIK